MSKIDISAFLKKSSHYALMPEGGVKCLACRHYCHIKEGEKGRCLVRVNKGNILYSPYGYLTALNIDPIEKKPLYHFLPGSQTLSFGMAGCNFRCDYCQNWSISQMFRDKEALADLIKISPQEIVDILLTKNLQVLVSTYNEPVISIEWADEIFSLAKAKNPVVKTGFVSNGYISTESLNFLEGKIDFIKVDLKSFKQDKYQSLTGGSLDNLLKAIKEIYFRKIHIEIVFLLVKDFNDSEEEIRNMGKFFISISTEIPLHITAFHPDYRMMDKEKTTVEDIEKAVDILKKSGLKFVYGGNVISPKLSNTYCPNCNFLLIKREYMSTEFKKIKVENGKGFCPSCNYKLYGIF